MIDEYLAKFEWGIDKELIQESFLELGKIIPGLNVIIGLIEKREHIIEHQGLNRAIETLKETLNIIKSQQKLDEKYIEENQREVYFIFRYFLSAVYNQYDEAFINFLSKYAANCLNEDFCENKLKVNILNRIAKYSKQHLLILKFIHDDCIEHGWPQELKNSDYNNYQQIEKMHDMDKSTIKFCLNELLRDGFIFQKLGMFNHNVTTPYEITEIGAKCLKMMDII